VSKAEELRKEANEAVSRARETKSLRQSAHERNRAAGLRQLADNEEWLDGKVKAEDPRK